MDKWFHPAHYNGCNYFSMLGLKLIHVSKSGSWSWFHCITVTVGCWYPAYATSARLLSTSCEHVYLIWVKIHGKSGFHILFSSDYDYVIKYLFFTQSENAINWTIFSRFTSKQLIRVFYIEHVNCKSCSQVKSGVSSSCDRFNQLRTSTPLHYIYDYILWSCSTRDGHVKSAFVRNLQKNYT